jgi:hypothetical protein
MIITTLTLGLWPKQGHGNVWAKNATRGSHSHSQEWKRVWGNERTHSQVDSHFGSYEVSNVHRTIQGSKPIRWRFHYTIGNFLKLKYLKLARMIHLNTYKSYDPKKSWKSKCQFDSQPLKVENCHDLHVWRWYATYHWKAFNKGYNFVLNLTSIGGFHKKLSASKVARVPISIISRLLNWESQKTWHLGEAPWLITENTTRGKVMVFPKSGPW